MSIPSKFQRETGSALLITLLVLCILSLLGFYLAIQANTGLEISDNYEAEIQATYAALAGLNHARALLRGLAFDDLLKGPDGIYENSSSYLAQAKKFEFRNPLPWQSARSLDIFDPAFLPPNVADDGLISTGFYNGSTGQILIPAAGITFRSENPYGPGLVVTSRYFVKVSDNNGDVSELSADPADNPFSDGDGIIIVRSIGVSKTIAQSAGPVRKLNSVSVFEARFKRNATFDAGPALTVIGNNVDASFEGAVEISGNEFPGIGAIDTSTGDAVYPDRLIQEAAEGQPNISGGGPALQPIQDISGRAATSPDLSLLLNPGYLSTFTSVRAPKIADTYLKGDQDWSDGNFPYAGAYDAAKPWNAPGQDPKIVVVDGNLNITGNFSGGGLLIVTGDFRFSGPYSYSGLILVIGSGSLSAEGSSQGVEGGTIVARVESQGEGFVFGTPEIALGATSRFVANKAAVRTALSLIPAAQISFREITGIDP
jgi:hypothetical protein